MLLFPCGHSFCAMCLRQHLEQLGRRTCPYCRETVASQAPNISLQQMIDGFVERQQAMGRGEVLPELVQGQDAVAATQQRTRRPPPAAHSGAPSSLASAPAADDEARFYAEQYRAFSMRWRVMANQLDESRAEAAGLRDRERTAETVRAHLETEAQRAAERLEAARLELEVTQSQLAEQSDKCAELNRQRGELEQMESLVGQSQASLELERQKALLLVRNFDAALAEELRSEFDG